MTSGGKSKVGRQLQALQYHQWGSPHAGALIEAEISKLEVQLARFSSLTVAPSARFPRGMIARPSSRGTPRRNRGVTQGTQWYEIAPSEFWPKPVVRDGYRTPSLLAVGGLSTKGAQQCQRGSQTHCRNSDHPFRWGVLRSAGVSALQQLHVPAPPSPQWDRQLR